MDRRFLRPGWLVGHVLVVLAVLTCLRLGWWQVDRSEEVDGTIQNVGYAVLWPCFAAAFIYMWVRFLQLERIRADEEAVEHATSFGRLMAEAESLTGATTGDVAGDIAAGVPGEPAGAGRMDDGSTGDGFVGVVGEEDADDPELTAYNRALAALAEKDRRAR